MSAFQGSMASAGFARFMAEACAEWEQKLAPLIRALEHDGLWAQVCHTGGGCMALEIRKAGDPIDPIEPFVWMTHDGEPWGSDCASLYDEGSPAGPFFLGLFFEGNDYGCEPAEEFVEAGVGCEHVGPAAWQLLAKAGVER